MKLKIYDDLDFSIIKSKWETSVNPIGVYIHSPFCPSICKFCIYAGTIQKHKSEYSDYFEDYLPKVIELYKPILEQKSKLINSWFFGGGTPSLVLPETLRNIFTSLPNFKTSKGLKTFEIHPAYWSIELLDLLDEFNFDIAIICLQSFDRKTLISQNRVPAKFDNIVNLSTELKKRNLKVFVDIIGFMNQNDDEIDVLIDDIEKAYTYISPDEISIQTIYQNKNFTEKTIESVLNSKFVNNNEYHIQYGSDFLELDKIDLVELYEDNKINKCFRLIKKSIDKVLVKKLMDLYNFMDPQYVINSNNHNTIAIGSYKNKSTQSHSNISSFNYTENNTDNIKPKFKFIKNLFIDEVQILLDMIKKIGEPKGYFEIKFTNQFICENEKPIIIDNYFYCEDIDYVNTLQKEIDDYMLKIKQLAICN